MPRMRKNIKNLLWFVSILLLSVAFVFPGAPPVAMAQTTARLVVDGRVITQTPTPVIRDGRVLVPVRLISEQLGATVHWESSDRSVTIERDGRILRLVVDNRLVVYQDGAEAWQVTDVPPRIIAGRTYVPVRLVANGLGITVNWDNTTGTVYVDSSVPSTRTTYANIRIGPIQAGHKIEGLTDLQIQAPDGLPQGAEEIRFHLLDPRTHKGEVIVRSNRISDVLAWLPQPDQNGQKLLAAGIYGSGGRFLAGTVMPIQVALVPRVTLVGLTPGQTITAPVSLQTQTNFVASSIRYEIIPGDPGRILNTSELDPQGSFRWVPQIEDKGPVQIRAVAYDRAGTRFAGEPVEVINSAARIMVLGGVSAGQNIDGPVTLVANRNFVITQAEYMLKDRTTGTEKLLGRTDGRSLPWYPGPDAQGNKDIWVRTRDSSGTTYTSEPVQVQIKGTPRLDLTGIGPKQVLSGSVKLGVRSNMPLSRVQYFRINPQTGVRLQIGETSSVNTDITVDPLPWGSGTWKIRAEGTYTGNRKVNSEEITLTVFTGRTYSARPVIAKDRFLDFSARMALESQKQTGMSAALQTAQAILETGWGQSVPVDKYNGQFSNNLFGIKGTGPAGSVISNTWEEYNGTVFRIDARFRAYHGVQASWDDHKRLLLTADRYGPFRDVMHDRVQGAWALRRAGYATDSQYPIKLINIMRQYELNRLDQVDI